MNKFQELGLKEEIVKALDLLGFEEPFPIQEEAIPLILEGNDLIGQAHTGTGKTAAFSLPILNMLESDDKVQALILTPTRELALQVTEEMRKFARYTKIKAVTIYGGQSINIQLDALKKNPDIIVATPGRLIDHMKRGSIRLDNIRFVVIDEADKMFEMGFVDDIKFILDRISNAQILLFSATMPNEVYEIAKEYMHEPKNVLLDADELSVDKINQSYLIIDGKEKFKYLCQHIRRDGQTIIFCSTKSRTRIVAKELKDNGFNAAPIHGDLTQSRRDSIMNGFRKGYYNILVATDLASRGIDVPAVGYVINYDVPNDPLSYFHRIGRTARAGKKGEALTLVSEYDREAFDRILKKTEVPIRRLNEQLGIEVKEYSRRYKPRNKQTRFRRNYYGLKSRW
ncbi:MAG: hypothetical protein KatS3mg003_0821 [Candidatus Nitrosocaldaceae archaeon]|nr:MAG: hypothetical protein KatS3mg003_0821 [Candidatus Nitrosocaldaceae archaeon]